jgi:hypothetical protein
MSGFDYSVPAQPRIDKDPAATLDYLWNWNAWLDGDTITAQNVTSDNTAVTVGAVTQSAGVVTAFVSGGATLPPGILVRLTCEITTAAGRTERRSIFLRMVKR